MLKRRIITALLLTALAVALVFALPVRWFSWVTAVIILLAAWEWSNLAGIKSRVLRLGYLVLIGFGLWGVRFLPITPVLVITCLWWLIALYLVLIYPQRTGYWSSVTVRCVIGFFVLVPSWLSIVTVRSGYHGSETLMFFLLLIWAADVGAYFAGKCWGKYKLLPSVSPGKTWQGFWGGLLLSLIVAIIAANLLRVNFASWLLIVTMVVLLNIYSVTGDLFESMLKRFSHLKDSSRILPGHGGILDRLDGITAAAPLFLLIWILSVNRL